MEFIEKTPLNNNKKKRKGKKENSKYKLTDNTHTLTYIYPSSSLFLNHSTT